MLEWDHSFLMFCRIEFCVSWKMFFFSGQWGYWIWCSEFVSFDLLSQRCSICMIGTWRLSIIVFLLFCVIYCSWPPHKSCDLVGSIIIIITFLIYMWGFCFNRVSTVPHFPLFLALEIQYWSLYSGRREGIENTAIGKLTFIRKVA
jgi:hypothetical protein